MKALENDKTAGGSESSSEAASEMIFSFAQFTFDWKVDTLQRL